ncbi:MAG: hypothetical protein JSV96_15650, partial [Candidatus Aminicenantes bacterium]
MSCIEIKNKRTTDFKSDDYIISIQVEVIYPTTATGANSVFRFLTITLSIPSLSLPSCFMIYSNFLAISPIDQPDSSHAFLITSFFFRYSSITVLGTVFSGHEKLTHVEQKK